MFSSKSIKELGAFSNNIYGHTLDTVLLKVCVCFKEYIDSEKAFSLEVLLISVLAHVVYDLVLLLYHLQCPVSKNGEKMIGAWIFTSGPISLKVHIERKGYCNGKLNHHDCYLAQDHKSQRLLSHKMSKQLIIVINHDTINVLDFSIIE